MADDTRRYVSHHRGSVIRGLTVRVLIRPSPKRKPNNVLVQTADGQQFVVPWRGLRRVRDA
ncbi:MAG: hypothetical protein U0990_09645 [Candidatus Nanopelagicales bacterium]|nr:hypothetical protein [Candidatus Nanopelagicales bacterium]